MSVDGVEIDRASQDEWEDSLFVQLPTIPSDPNVTILGEDDHVMHLWRLP